MKMKVTGNFATEQRITWLREQLDNEGRVEITQAAVELGVSEMTIRRDLQDLESMGCARRVRGGAVAVGPVAFAERHRHRARAKAKLATKLAELVPSSGTIGVDASSTLLRLTSVIDSARDLTVLTNSVETFQALQGKPGVSPLITGGQLEPRTGSLVGPLASRLAKELLLNRLFVSAAGVDPTVGSSENCLEEADVKRAMASVAAEVVLAVDSSKLGQRSLAVSLHWEDVDVLVTELDPADARLEPYRSLVSRIL